MSLLRVKPIAQSDKVIPQHLDFLRLHILFARFRDVAYASDGRRKVAIINFIIVGL